MLAVRRFVVWVVVLGSVGPPTIVSAQPKKKADPKAAELEKTLLDMPEDAGGAWLKAWRDHSLMTYSIELKRAGIDEIVRFTLDNRTPCTIRVSGKQFQGLSTTGRPRKPAKDKEDADETWTVEPGKKLVIFKRPQFAQGVLLVPLKNDLNRKVEVFAIRSGPLCQLHVTPSNPDAKPLDLSVLTICGYSGTKANFSGYYLCKPGDEKAALEKIR